MPVRREAVHVVTVRLDETRCREDVLDVAEQVRAARFVRERDRRRFRVAHAALRHILAEYLGNPPRAIRFTYAAQGKPAVVNDLDLRFNLSHAGERALVAIAVGRDVGIDIEEQRDIDVLGLAREVCSPAERQVLAAAVGDRRLELFYRCWTRKESFVKARGDGLSFPVRELHVRLDAEGPQLLVASARRSADVDRWTIRALPADPGCVAALTTEGDDFTIVSRQFATR